jgi:TPR repeat protein
MASRFQVLLSIQLAPLYLGVLLDQGVGGAAPDYPAAAGWFERAATAGHELAANNLCNMYTIGRGLAWQIMPAIAFLHI